jgi:pyridoxamine 5'-phosphate oxidase
MEPKGPGQPYAGLSLLEKDMDADPIRQFARWLDEAGKVGLKEPLAMTLATADAEGRPAARVVLLRGVDARGFAFYTNYESRKGQDLLVNPRAALAFYWDALDRQVRITGPVERVSAEESDAYFATRHRGSQLAAWASPQSAVVADRAALDARYREMEERFAGREIPRPPHWGGYRVVPEVIEFWQARPNRFHDRLRYRREGDRWILERLAP